MSWPSLSAEQFESVESCEAEEKESGKRSQDRGASDANATHRATISPSGKGMI